MLPLVLSRRSIYNSPRLSGGAGSVDVTDSGTMNPKVLYIGGAGRSGSTLLGMILGSTPVFFNAGELRWFWSAVHGGTRRCSCRSLVTECPFWSGVISDLQAAKIDIPHLAALTPRLTHTRNLLRISTRRFSSKTARNWDDLLSATQRLYEVVFDRCGGKIILDGSKIPPQLVLLQKMPHFDLRILHLVRDGRGVAYSWEKRQRVRSTRKTRKGKERLHALYRSSHGAMLAWIIKNILLNRMARRQAHRSLMRYEDFAAHPEATVRKSLNELGIKVDLDILKSKEISLPTGHNIAGSGPVRFASNRRKITSDDAWKTQMRPMTRITLTLIGLYWLRRFGYELRV